LTWFVSQERDIGGRPELSAIFSNLLTFIIHVSLFERSSQMPLRRVRFGLKNAAGVAGVLLAGYVIVTSLPDLRRYIKITRM